MLTVHMNEVQGSFSIHAYSVCWSNLTPWFFSHLPTPPQSLFYFSGQLWFLSSWISALAHFPPPPHIQLHPFCCMLYDSTCPHGWITLYHVCIPHTLIRSPTAEPSCGRGSLSNCERGCDKHGCARVSSICIFFFNGRMSKRKFR